MMLRPFNLDRKYAGLDAKPENNLQSYNENTEIADNNTHAISVERVSKSYHIYNKPSDRLKQMMLGWHRPYFTSFSALSNINLKLKRGETVGIVGRNGSGKSTLLQVICGTVRASSGNVEINGRLAALLELGAGFNPEFTGRENVFLHGSILGLSRTEMKQRFEEIVDFADIGAFIDRPVKTYSSGMYVRLAFSAAIHADPDILIVDEALSVGDEAFRRKCFARIEQIKNSGATILFVSHSANSIMELCSRAILLDQGEKILEGTPKYVINQYQRLINLKGEEARLAREHIIRSGLEQDNSPRPYQQKNYVDTVPALKETFSPNLISKSKVVYESHGAVISDLKLTNREGKPVNTLQFNQDYTYSYRVHFEKDFSRVAFGMLIKNTKGIGIVGSSTQGDKNLHLTTLRAGMTAEVRFNFKCKLRSSTYFINAGVTDPNSPDGTFIHRILDGLVFNVAPVETDTSTGIVDIGVEPIARIIDQL